MAVRTRPHHPGSGHRWPGAENSKADPLDRPLSSLLMHIATFDTSAGITQHLVQVEAQVKAETLVQPLLVLTDARPDAWPLYTSRGAVSHESWAVSRGTHGH